MIAIIMFPHSHNYLRYFLTCYNKLPEKTNITTWKLAKYETGTSFKAFMVILDYNDLTACLRTKLFYHWYFSKLINFYTKENSVFIILNE